MASLLLLLLSCASSDEALLTGVSVDSKAVIAEGTPEALGVLAFVNDPGTTQAVLTTGAGIQTRAAREIIAHRDGATASASDDDLFDTIAELDAVPWVGDATLSAILAYADANGWVDSPDGYYGTVEGVSFTNAEASGVVDLVNGATFTELDVTVGLDRRAATNLVAGAPYATIEEIAAVSYVGPSALTTMRDYVDALDAQLSTADAVAALTAAVPGLYFTSESDYPLVVWQIAAPSTTTLTSSNVKSILASVYVYRTGTTPLSLRSVEATTVADVFDRYTTPQDWWDETWYDQQAAWQGVRAVFDDHLESVTVWRLGRRSTYGLIGDIDIFVVGVTSDGGLVGISTVSVET